MRRITQNTLNMAKESPKGTQRPRPRMERDETKHTSTDLLTRLLWANDDDDGLVHSKGHLVAKQLDPTC